MTVAPFAVLWYAAPLFMAGLLGVGFLCGLLGPVVQRALAARRRGVAAAERTQKTMRVVHRTSRREPPSRELLVRCWELSRTSLEGKILLGSLLGDVDAVEDHSYIRGDGGEIVGRHGGVRRWLDAGCPELAPHYKTLMRYKAMADKFRRTCGLGDPDSAEDALAAGETCAGEIADFRFQISNLGFQMLTRGNSTRDSYRRRRRRSRRRETERGSCSRRIERRKRSTTRYGRRSDSCGRDDAPSRHDDLPRAEITTIRFLSFLKRKQHFQNQPLEHR